MVPAAETLQDSINKVKLENESIDTEKKFNDLVQSLQNSLKHQNKSVSDICRCLSGISCMTQVYDGEDQCVFRKKRKRLKECSTISDAWCILCDYFSFFDFYIIELITKELGTKDDGVRLGQYKAEFGKYLNNRIFPLKIIRSEVPRDDSMQIVLKLDPSYDECNLAHLEDLKKAVTKLLKLEPCCVQLYEIRQGCIQLILLIPEFIVDSIFPLTPEQELALHQLKVTRLDCGDFYIGKGKKSKLQHNYLQ